jgi:RND superfamily putative drug exporter
VVRTGPVISSCGIIMAATLGSLWAGRLSLLQQLGFALALGVLIDTFFVRPLLIPAFFMVIGNVRSARQN